MGKLLTKEQNGMVLAKCREGFYEGCITDNDLASAINACTEKPFPEYILPIKRLDGVEVGSISMVLSPGKGVYIHALPEFMLWAVEFKQFTEACNKIVEWMDEQQ